jgi:hydrogenase maturation factor
VNIEREIMAAVLTVNNVGKAWLVHKGYITIHAVDDERQIEITDAGWIYFRNILERLGGQP